MQLNRLGLKKKTQKLHYRCQLEEQERAKYNQGRSYRKEGEKARMLEHEQPQVAKASSH